MRKRSWLLWVTAGLAACSGQPETAPTTPAPAPVSAATSTPTAPLPHAQELESFEKLAVNASPLQEVWPNDPAELVTITVEDDQRIIISAFGAAISQGRKDQIGAYIAKGADLHAPVWYQVPGVWTVRTFPAHLAINAAHVLNAPATLLEDLLRQGADPNAVEVTYTLDKGALAASEQTVLYHAVTSGMQELLELVLAQEGIDVNSGAQGATDRPVSPLFAAVLRSDAEAVRKLLDAGADPAKGSSSAPLELAQNMLQREPNSAAAAQIVGLLEGASTR